LVILIYRFALGSQKVSFTFTQSVKGNTGAYGSEKRNQPQTKALIKLIAALD